MNIAAARISTERKYSFNYLYNHPNRANIAQRAELFPYFGGRSSEHISPHSIFSGLVHRSISNSISPMEIRTRSREINTIKVPATEMLFPLGQRDSRVTVTELLHFSLFVFASLSRDLVPIILGLFRFASSMNAMNDPKSRGSIGFAGFRE